MAISVEVVQVIPLVVLNSGLPTTTSFTIADDVLIDIVKATNTVAVKTVTTSDYVIEVTVV